MSFDKIGFSSNQMSAGASPPRMSFCLLVELNGKFLLILSNMSSESMKWVAVLKWSVLFYQALFRQFSNAFKTTVLKLNKETILTEMIVDVFLIYQK